jgi:hypothetical protein
MHYDVGKRCVVADCRAHHSCKDFEKAVEDLDGFVFLCWFLKLLVFAVNCLNEL